MQKEKKVLFPLYFFSSMDLDESVQYISGGFQAWDPFIKIKSGFVMDAVNVIAKALHRERTCTSS